MKSAELFFNKVLEDEELVNLLSYLPKNQWKKLDYKTKLDIFSNIIEKMSRVFDINKDIHVIYVKDNTTNNDALSYNDQIIINLDIMDIKKSPFYALKVSLHELRHYLQDYAIKEYRYNNIVNEFYTENELKELDNNARSSALNTVSNYVDGDHFNYYEYLVQPVELDADTFANYFLRLYVEKFLKDSDDIKACQKEIEHFDNSLLNITPSEDDYFNFSNIYRLNYDDMCLDNERVFRRENYIYAKYDKLLTNLLKVDNKSYLGLFTPFLWDRYDFNSRIKLINAYFYKNQIKDRVTSDDFDNVYINDEQFNINSCYKSLEATLLTEARNKIDILLDEKTRPSKLTKLEKEIIEYEKHNHINKQKHPFLCKMEPQNIYISNFMYKSFIDYYDILSKTYVESSNYFSKIINYIEKYDVEMMKIKIENMLGEDFNVLYKKLISNGKVR